MLTRAKAAEQKNLELEARVRSLETKPAVQTTQALPTLQEVLVAYDKGQITETIKDQWVHYHSKEAAKREFGEAVMQAATVSRSQGIVNEYIKAYPTLSDMHSPEFRALAQTFNELALEESADGQISPTKAVAIQAKALQMTFGRGRRPVSPSGLESRPDTFVEGGGGGGQMSRESDPLKDISERQKAYWKSQGYTKAQMIDEAKYGQLRNVRAFRNMAGSKKK